MVDAIPENLPTIVTLGQGTELETVFSAEAATGDSPSNFALTGVARLKGANENLPSGTSITCLNHEEFFNQYEERLEQFEASLSIDGDLVEIINDDTMATASETTLSTSESIKVYVDPTITTVSSSATPTPTGDKFSNVLTITALAEAAEFAAPSGTPADQNKLLIRVLDDATARALTWNAIYEGTLADLPSTTTVSKYLYCLFVYNSTASKWQLLATGEQG